MSWDQEIEELGKSPLLRLEERYNYAQGRLDKGDGWRRAATQARGVDGRPCCAGRVGARLATQE